MDKATALEIICQIEEAAKRLTYKVGKYTFKVAMAPLSWPLTHEEIESIDGLTPKEAIRQARVNNSPYVANGKHYVPMSVKEAMKYREKGIASWYGDKTLGEEDGYMTANGEVFDPNGLSAAHKYLPLPTYVRVINLENHRSIIVRVNNRGPFVSERIIDLSAGAARKLGFYKKGTARVLVETVKVED
ncbi:MAG: septal ring lytic transglycosylase RlpA family protein [Deltaproteobacteria bacterium]|nr:septal ring lytic transglycosylase RlpA family protein [Deltaproteobacteria bacterium]